MRIRTMLNFSRIRLTKFLHLYLPTKMQFPLVNTLCIIFLVPFTLSFITLIAIIKLIYIIIKKFLIAIG